MGSASHGAVTALSQVEIVSFSDVALLEGSIFQANISEHSFTIQADLSKTWAEHISEIISSNANLTDFVVAVAEAITVGWVLGMGGRRSSPAEEVGELMEIL